MCPLTGHVLPSARLKCQHAVFCSVWQEAWSGCPLMTLKHLLLSRKWICFSGALSSSSSLSLFSNWINWSNRRLSYPCRHAFYLSLIALSFTASFCLATFTYCLCLVCLPFSFLTTVNLLYKQPSKSLFVLTWFLLFKKINKWINKRSGEPLFKSEWLLILWLNPYFCMLLFNLSCFHLPSATLVPTLCTLSFHSDVWHGSQ